MSGAHSPVAEPTRGTWPARLALMLLGLAVVLGPNGWFYLNLTPNSYDHQRFWMLAGLAGIVALLLLSPSLRQEAGRIGGRLPPWAGWGIGLFFVFGLTSALLALSPLAALLEWGTYLLGIVGVLTVAAARYRLGREGDGLLLALVVAAVAVYAGDFLAFYLPTADTPWITISWGSPFFHFMNVRFLNQWQTWTLPLLAGAVVLAGGYSRVLRALLLLVGSFWWALLFATGGRGSLVATFLAMLLVLLFFRKQSRQWTGAVIALAAGGGLLYLLLFHLAGTQPGLGRAISESGNLDSGRIHQWLEALAAATSHPFLGIGPMQLSQALEDRAHPHNLLLQLAAEWGLPATLAAVTLTLGGLATWIQQCRHFGFPGPGRCGGQGLWASAIHPSVTAALLAGLGHALVSGVGVMPISQSLGILVTGWLLGLHMSWTPGRPFVETEKARVEGWGVALAGVLGLMIMAPALAQTLPRLSTAFEAYQDSDRGNFRPRFWLQGDICLPPWPAAHDTACSRQSHTTEAKP